MLAFGFLVLIPLIGSGRGLRVLFAAPFAFALLVLATRPLSGISGVYRRGFEIAAVALIPFVGASFVGAGAVEKLLIAAVVFITWFSALDYLKFGFPAVARAPSHRLLHWLRLGAGALLPIGVMAALATHRLPTIPLIILLASDMARGALDNFAANQGIADFSWAASMGGELALLAAALVFPLAGSHLSIVAAVVAVAETLRSLVKYLRAPTRPPLRPTRRRSARLLLPSLKGADHGLGQHAQAAVGQREASPACRPAAPLRSPARRAGRRCDRGRRRRPLRSLRARAG